eukprot:TRINITY_DN2582_c1_g2_i2.p1 TRINITY_DN2582_c1_g2~~TRINITY_DN2582_c1_g2_i2.p1  ORF type:complete len:237 (-),score=-8.05 TRINITY_DN2582_c1_g2_i2:291-1001(-)
MYENCGQYFLLYVLFPTTQEFIQESIFKFQMPPKKYLILLVIYFFIHLFIIVLNYCFQYLCRIFACIYIIYVNFTSSIIQPSFQNFQNLKAQHKIEHLSSIIKMIQKPQKLQQIEKFSAVCARVNCRRTKIELWLVKSIFKEFLKSFWTPPNSNFWSCPCPQTTKKLSNGTLTVKKQSTIVRKRQQKWNTILYEKIFGSLVLTMRIKIRTKYSQNTHAFLACCQIRYLLYYLPIFY